jgi:flagellar hook-basal body complex protein FliE
MPVDAITAVGPEWQIALPAESADAAAPAAGGSGFGAMLADQIGGLQQLQTDAATQSQALATGTAEDASQVVMAVERAQLSMQLASTLRDKSVEAFQEIFRTQV